MSERGKKPSLETQIKYDSMRAYKLEGHTNKEVAERFGLSLDYTRKICRGVCRQDFRTRYESKGIENVMALVKACNPDMEYAGGFTDYDSPIQVRCLKCGNVFTRSMGTIRHGRKTRCPNCFEKKPNRQKLPTEEKERRRTERHIIAIQAKAKRKQEAKESRRHNCPVCGKSTTRRKYCSQECGNKAENRAGEIRRRVQTKKQMVDRDITLEKLFSRDGGTCWICGGQCDWNDFTYKGETFIAGADYPSIDHVVELCNGGEHSWRNVKLAHRSCNSARYYKPLCG